MRIHNLYADENGDTHFRDIEIELTETGPDGTVSKLLPATGIIFRTTPGDWYFGWHRTTRRQYVVNLDAPHQVTASEPPPTLERDALCRVSLPRDRFRRGR